MENIFDTPLCRHEYVLNFCVRNSRKSKREQKLCCAKQKQKQKKKFRVKRKCARVLERVWEKEKGKKDKLSWQQQHHSVKSNPSYLYAFAFAYICVCVFSFRSFRSSACCYLVGKISVEHHRQHESKANAESGTYRQKPGFYFIFPFHVSFFCSLSFSLSR